MSEEKEVRATHQEVEQFVAKLSDFHGSLGESEQAMLGTILDGAVAGESGGYLVKARFADQGGPKPWEDLVGWMESQGGEDTQGFVARRTF